MADSLTLRVITPERVVLDTTVSSVKFPGLDGLIGVLPKHAHMVSALDSGLLEWSTGGGAPPEDMFVAGGFAEVRGNTVRIVTEAGEMASEIEVGRAEKAAVRAKERLKTRRVEAGTAEFDVLRAEASLRRALMRAFVAGRTKR